jgi:hypothetical protein
MLKVDKERAEEIVYGDNPDFDVIEDKMVGKGRWDIQYKVIVKEIATGKYYRIYFSRGSTEYQDTGPFDDKDPRFEEVFPVETAVIVYKSQREMDADQSSRLDVKKENVEMKNKEQQFRDLVGEVLLYTNTELVIETHKKEGTTPKYDFIAEAEKIKQRIIAKLSP